MKYFKFVKEKNSKWYAILPKWTGDKQGLEMTSGANTFLERLSQGEDSVEVCISKEPFEKYKYKLSFVNHLGGGGTYHLQSDLYEFPVWLSQVIEFVFGELPKDIYVS